MAKMARKSKKKVGGKKKVTPKKKVAARASTLALTASPKPTDIVDIPPANTFNVNLNSASEATMLQVFGTPGQKTKHCSPATGNFKKRVVTQSVGPFRVTGLDVAVASLKAAFAEAEEQLPNVIAQVKTEGMLCVRHKRNNPNSFSNHSWGTAIDLRFGDDDVVPQGVKKTHLGNLQLAPFFNKHGWFWGAGFSGNSVDSMHFELSEEAVKGTSLTS
jgi:D-alanyl-D-alanine carboxypeptidase-like protein